MIFVALLRTDQKGKNEGSLFKKKKEKEKEKHPQGEKTKQHNNKHTHIQDSFYNQDIL